MTQLDAAAARAAIPALRRSLTMVAAGIYPIMLAEAGFSHLEGRPGWAVFWCALFAAFGALFVVGIRNDLRREAIVLAAPDDAVRAYLRARLATAVKAARDVRVWMILGAVFVVLGIADTKGTGDGAMFHAYGNLLLGGYFLGSRLATRFVQAPRLERELAAAGGPLTDPARDPAILDLTRRVLAERNPVQAIAFWREMTGQSLAEARASIGELPSG